jgi:hypothetical protein
MERRSTRTLTTVAKLLASIWLFWTIAAPSAHAYIDPGSSSFIIQILIGALAGAGLAIATFWRRIRMFFSRNKDKDAGAQTPPPAVPPTSTSE